MIAVIDTNIIIQRKLSEYEFSKGFITPSILVEVRGEDLNSYLDLYAHKIEIVQPDEKYLKKVYDLQKEKNLLLSVADIEVVALTLQLNGALRRERLSGWITKENIDEKIECLSLDNGVQHCLRLLKCADKGTTSERDFMFRCVSCFSLYEEKLDFCKKCASNLITRVSVKKENGKIKLFLKKGFKMKKTELKDKYGNILHSEDQNAYKMHIREKSRTMQN
ncbi:putative RNA-binding protein Nob1p involved in 26S proteasome assembly [Trachipleistophora hominis]|uniref:Putative RNA-binding protein Nob1p involved in 26S proteasome assembly n=1 Tax=Trachipleistophora hominis TaxID=72359 RepID=L7JT43_TRAHO|nr:putative RNA-binding protein Nob1p involved in 26S proteasome assembly [Trachipleistophora hominis]